MKISKKYLLIGLISLLILFVPRETFALVSDYYTEWKYSETLQNNINSYSNKINNIKTYLSNNVVNNIDVNDNKRLLMFDMDTINSNDVLVRIVDVTETNDTKIENTYGQYNSYKHFAYYYVFTEFKCTFNNDNLTSCVLNSNGSWYLEYRYSNLNCDPTQENCLIEENRYYFDTTYVLDTYSINFVAQYENNNTYYDIPIKHNNIITLPGLTLNYKEYFDSLGPQQEQLYCSRSQVLGAVSNVSSITFNVKGLSNALSEQLNGRISLSYEHSSILSSNDFDVSVSFNEDFISGDYDFTCSSNEQYCELTYSYAYQDDIDTELDLNFTIKTISGVSMPYFIRMYACTKDDVNNTTFSYSYNILPPGSSSDSSSSINNFLQDGNLPDVSGLVDTSLVPAGPLDSILLLPLNVMQALLNVLNSSTCRPLVLPLPFVNQNLTLPCISTIYSQINGLNVFLNWFSAIFSAYILYQYFIYLYKWVDDTLTLRENTQFGGF